MSCYKTGQIGNSQHDVASKLLSLESSRYHAFHACQATFPQSASERDSQPCRRQQSHRPLSCMGSMLIAATGYLRWRVSLAIDNGFRTGREILLRYQKGF